MSTLVAAPTPAEQERSRAALWIIEPRVSLAYAVSDFGQRIMRLAGHISAEPITDVGHAMDEAFDAGYRCGHRAGSRNATSEGPR